MTLAALSLLQGMGSRAGTKLALTAAERVWAMARARGQGLHLVTLSSPSSRLLLPHGAEKRYLYLPEAEEQERAACPRGERVGRARLEGTAV